MVSALNHSFMMRSTLLENKFSWFAFGFSRRACYRTKFQPFWSQTYQYLQGCRRVWKHGGAVVKSNQYKKFAPNALQFTYWNLKSCKQHEKQNKKLQNTRSIDEKLKTESLMLFASFFSCDLQDFKFQHVHAQASCTELTLLQLK